MSREEEDDFWNTSGVKPFNFDDEVEHTNTERVKTLGAILAPTPSNEPFLRPSIIMCPDPLENFTYSKPVYQAPSTRLDPKTYIRDIVEKKAPIDFSSYKSKREKLLLLDSAICLSDGNAITAVTIFISKTLKPSIFMEELKKRPIAVDHYINYLEMTGRLRETVELTKKFSS